MSERTKLPWKREGRTIYALNADGHDAFRFHVKGGMRNCITRTPEAEIDAVAEFAYRACNSHAALVEALKNIVDQRVLTPSARSNARAALKLAEGK